jgi:hypothetical protein
MQLSSSFKGGKIMTISEIKDHFDEEVIISGFVDEIRNLKWVQFVVLRDHTGKVQITIEKSEEANKELVEIVDNLTVESTLKVTGKVMDAPKVKMGGVEVIPSKIEVTSKNLGELPFNYKERIEKVKKGIELNQIFYNKVASLYALEFDHLSYTKEEYEEHRYFEEYLIRGFFMSCLMRDWTLESKPERDNNYGNVLKEVKKYYNYDDKNLMKNNNYKALVPGTGCSRMAFELAKRGFEVEANDDKAIKEFDRLGLISSDVIRHLITKIEK